MCYDAETATRQSLRYAIHRTEDSAEREALQRKLDELFGIELTAYYHISGFAHPKVLVFTNTQPLEPKAFFWGLIPYWVKDKTQAKEFANKCLNARGETIFEKASFKNSAKSKRCLIYLDAFYEHHHAGGKTFPFRISMKDNSPMVIAGLWDEWTDKETGEIIPTCTIVTTEGNRIMSKIHNNPKADGPRMPLILVREQQDEWLKPVTSEDNKRSLEELIKPFDESMLKFHTVNRLKGKDYIGNVEQIEEPCVYPELNWENQG